MRTLIWRNQKNFPTQDATLRFLEYLHNQPVFWAQIGLGLIPCPVNSNYMLYVKLKIGWSWDCHLERKLQGTTMYKCDNGLFSTP